MHLETDHDRRAPAAVGDAQESSALADLILDLERGARAKPRAIHRMSGVRADTHWSRILSVDLDGDDDGWPSASTLPADAADSRSAAGDRVARPFVAGAVVLFAVCALLYLAVTGGLHALAAPDGTGAPAPDTAASPHRFATENDHARIDPIP